MFKDKRNNTQVLNHSIATTSNFDLSSKDFYERIEDEIKAKKLPGLSISKVEYSEGGMLSDKRIYLRVIRERYAFDTCAAPFGTEFFFSYRSIYSPAKVTLKDVFIVLLFFVLIYLPLIYYLGLYFGTISVLTFTLAIAQVFRGVVSAEIADLDSFFQKVPGFGPIYELYFRKQTYYREDTRLLYMKIIPGIVDEVIDDITAKYGIKLNRFDRNSGIGELYKPRKEPIYEFET